MIAIQKIGKSFMGALKYNLRKFSLQNPDKRAEILDSNFETLNLDLIREEVELVRSLRPNLSRYVYHTSLNFSSDDKLDNEKLLSVAYEYLTESGYTNNQYMIFRHYDADHPHIHLLANRICFDGTVVPDSNNYRKSEAILRKLEERYKLVAVEKSSSTKRKASTKDELEMMRRTGSVSDKWALQELLIKLVRESKTISELIAGGEKAGISFLFNQASTGRVTGISYRYKGFKSKGQALGNAFKWSEVIKKVGYEQARDRKAISEANARTNAIFDNERVIGNGGKGTAERDVEKNVNSEQKTLSPEDVLIQVYEGDEFSIRIDIADDEDDAKKRRMRGLQR